MPYFRALWLIFILVTTWLRFGYSPFITYFYFFIIGYKEVTNWLQQWVAFKKFILWIFFESRGVAKKETARRAIARERIASREVTQDELYFKMRGRGQSILDPEYEKGLLALIKRENALRESQILLLPLHVGVIRPRDE